MDKKTKVAIDNIQAQIEKGNNPNIQHKAWKIQCQSILKKYFTKDSKEYTWFDRPTISFAYYSGDPQENINNETAKSTRDTQHHLQASLETLKIKGLPKEHTTNYLSRLSDTWITTLLVLNFSAYGLMFYIGRWTVETEKKSFSTGISPTLPIIKDKTGQQTDTTKNTTRY